MPKASVKRLIECTKNQLIDLVLDIEKYPKFVPFCLDAHIYEKKKKKRYDINYCRSNNRKRTI